MSDSRDVLRQALVGEPTSRVATGPLAVHYCARLCGVSLRNYTTNPRLMAECVLRYYERFRPDAVWVSADTWVTAEAMGARVAFLGDDQPLGGVGPPLIQSQSDVDRLPAPDPQRQGRCPLMIEALARVVEGLQGRAYVVACFDQYPFSLACALMGLHQVLLSLTDDPSLVLALMDRCAEFACAYARALAAAGADLLSGGDSPAGLIGPRRYREIALPFERRLIQELHAGSRLPVSLHICGNSTPLLADMATTGADVLELDYQVDLAEACRILGSDVTVWGNLDPVGLLARGGVDQIRRATVALITAMQQRGHRRFVLSSGCTLAVETPPENLDMMLQTARQCVI